MGERELALAMLLRARGLLGRGAPIAEPPAA